MNAKSASQDAMLPILIAPNVSEQMGGEAMKALQIFREMKKIIPQTIQITHERNRAELRDRLKMDNTHFVEDTWVSVFLWKSVVFRALVDVWFSMKAVALAERLAEQAKASHTNLKVVIHQTEPNSPVAPRALSKKHFNVAGPINGNIYYPAIFRDHETKSTRLRRWLHMPLQHAQRLTYSSLRHMDMIFCAGGDRTRVSLLAAGCPPKQLVDTVDCGISDKILDRKPALQQAQSQARFIHFGRLVFHKGTALIIEALAQPGCTAQLDIVGRGPELDHCKALAAQLKLGDRVRFLDWYTSHDELLDSFSGYCGVVLPSIEDANGIVVQESMAMGLPAVCLDWGGPQLLVRHGKSGYLVGTQSKAQILADLAKHMSQLCSDSELARDMGACAREDAQAWRWSTVIQEWLGHYRTLPRLVR